ncbi:hypothetical protein [Sporomusa acidovorans]|uniref:Uncharacterized protein n=1 Tax=Sporomusa acidovorans (strain ATCC 49682 / DSM 3132 / Mol) TaxID=1123286 RepID=A0ABZ3JBC9_SPOA4|nr:hypothetical protein [Sporomusa acidovorans]OZC13267.1 hypothetical protein SPACI_57620 [Sporomusa acidovorans DSM 3132]SDD98665.1 hypothetical protein SAMN04488499_100688 [Sporomusa acidovorans]
MTDEARQGNNFIEQLCFFQGQQGVNIRTWGGFQFTCGRLMDIDDCLATLTDVSVVIPGSPECFELNFVTVNLSWLTSFGISDRKNCPDCDKC